MRGYSKSFLLLLFLSIFFISGCFQKIQASKYEYGKYHREPLIGKHVQYIYKSSFKVVSIYEIEKVKSVSMPIRTEDIYKDGKRYHVLFLYDKMVKKDDLYSDEELIPVIVSNENYSIVGAGWKDLNKFKIINDSIR
jgi:hypothetical protein